MGVFKNKGTPQIIHFNRVFHHKPSILGYPYFWKYPVPRCCDVLKSVEKLGSEDFQTQTIFFPIGILDAARSYPLAWRCMLGVPNPPKKAVVFFELTTCQAVRLGEYMGDFLVATMTFFVKKTQPFSWKE